MTRLSRFTFPLLSTALLFSAALPLTVMLSASSASAASWQTGKYGGKLTMTYYVPDGMPEKAPLVLALHFCSGKETDAQSWLKSFADTNKFMIISPKSPGNCWDAAPGRSGDRAELASMIDWAITNNKVDPARVYAAGASSGACMSETMLASYPDKIAAASVLAGVPVGFWMTGNDCNVCSMQVATGSAMTWGDKVRAAGPAMYTGSRGRIQLFHAIKDQYLGSGNLAVEVSQWTNALGITDTGTEEKDKPRSGWTRTSYKDSAGAIAIQSNWWGNSPANSHDLTSNITPALWNEVVAFFGLDKATMPAPSGTTTGGTAPPPSATMTGTSAPGATGSASGAATTTAPGASSASVPTTTPTMTIAAVTATQTPPSATTAAAASSSAPVTTPTTGASASASATTGTGAGTSPTTAGTSTTPASNNGASSDSEGGCQVSHAPTRESGAALAALGLAFAAMFSRRRRSA